ncbi:hypothetical protein [Bacillus cihuensis]|uniref:hypothetical protein n=1 Tax=Bacillus cihuensis TaxID=1208599 RepID=UPI00048B4C88|nr:hypothetical protein [Bacillus cihuensis]
MKKKLWISVLILAIIIGGIYSIVKVNPPLEIGTLASSEDNKSVVVGIGNKGFREIKILDVSVNNNDVPSKTKLQVSNALQGFIITDNYNNEDAKKYGLTNIDGVAIKSGTSPSSNFEKLDDGNASKDDEIYGISVIYNKEINKVHIKYSYFGISFKETVIIN